ncbi:MAG: ABC transporter substrate-binding protein [Rhodospirillaceae bacterium]|nr:ABC transporter substrate-binding protein [Rhodospirillaceae bacterium]
MKLKTILHSVALASALFAVGQTPAAAAEFPEKPVRLIVPYGPGGGTDTIARIITGSITGYLGQPMVIINRPGATGTVGTAAAAAADPDGYTVLISDSASMSVKPQTEKLPYAYTDFKVVASINEAYFMLSTPKSKGISSLKEFIAAAKERKLTYATSGIGSPFHLAMEQMARVAGIEKQLTHIPFSGTGKAVTAALGGHVDAIVSYPNAVISYVEDGKLNGLAVSAKKPLTVLPDVPTFAGSGVDFTSTGWKALFVRADTPKDRFEALQKAALALGTDKGFKKLMKALGETISVKPGAEFEPVWHAEYKAFANILADLGMTK